MDKLDKILQKKIGFKPHKKQKLILDCKSVDVVICAGRRFGKSLLCAYIALKTIVEGDSKGRPVRIWIVSPTYELSKKVFDYLVRWFLVVFPSQTKGVSMRPFPQIKTARGSWVQCKSAETPTGLLGEELDLLIVDECSRIKKNVYETYLYPTTVSRGGKTVFISTPFGKNWFYDQWILAKNTGGSFQFKTSDNPNWVGRKTGWTLKQWEAKKDEQWEKNKAKLPQDVFEQEFLATFKDQYSSVFRNIRRIIDPGALKGPVPGHKYVIGLDLAKFRDFSVLSVVDAHTHGLVYFDRFQRIPYTLQRKRVANVARKYNHARIIVDALNVGASVVDELRAEGLKVLDFKSSGSVVSTGKKGSKEKLIERLSLFIEDQNISIPPEDKLVDELESFGYQLTDSGNIKYGAPIGLHDDCVISLALAVWGLKGKVRKQNTLAAQSKPRKINRFQYL